jgi:hypothetical protein
VKIRHYYHCYAAGAWSAAVRDHFTALGRAGLDDAATTVGLVGPEEDRKAARDRIGELSRKWVIPAPERWTEQDEGWEQVTLRQIHADVHRLRGEFAVLYAHTKGAAFDLDASVAWRRSMTKALIGDWEQGICLLEEGYDAVGCHWVTDPRHRSRGPFFAGNFWLARASYLRMLPAPESGDRWQAETWVSGKNPAVYDVLPGWPEYG